MEQREKSYDEILEKVNKLPLVYQDAMIWLLDNLDWAERAAQEETWTEKEYEDYIQWALQRKDYCAYVLILYIQERNKRQ